MVMETGLGAIDLQARQVELSAKLRDFVVDRIHDEFGLTIPEITMNISLPDEITQAMTRGVAKGVETSGYVENVDLGKLQQARAADAILAAAENPGGSVMGDMMQMGMGMAMAGQMADAMNPGATQPQAPQAGVATPPPLPGQKMFHVDHGGTPGGPYNMAQMQQGIHNGTVTGQTLVWTQGMANWVPANTVPELQAMFAAPPPLPPQAPPPVPPTPPAGS
jgi:membrane protease subunit (stomatin/prohibitin family)